MGSKFCASSNKILLSLLIGIFTFLLLFMLVNHYLSYRYEHQIGNDYASEKVLRTKIIKNDSIKAEDLDSLFSTWHSIMRNERQQIRLEQKTAEQSLTIWLGIIAAICTILPIVIGLNQAINIDHQLERQEQDFSKEITNASNDMDRKISEKEEQLKKVGYAIDQVNASIATNKLISFISTLSISIKIISELEELEIRENISLTCPKLLKVQLDKIKKCTQSCLDEYRKLSPQTNDAGVAVDIQRTIMGCSLDYWVMLNNLLKKFETKFSSSSLWNAHDLMDDIWNKIESLLENDKEAAVSDFVKVDIDKEFCNMNLYAVKVRDLFIREFCEEE